MAAIPGVEAAASEVATSVRARRNDVIVTDGPFAETREHLGGFYVVDVASRERAIELATLLPGVRFGVVEIRPIHPDY